MKAKVARSIAAALLVGIAGCAMTAAAAPLFRGGGGGFHGGGFHAPAMRFGGGGARFAGMHFAAPRFAARRFGGAHFAGRRFAAPHFAAGHFGAAHFVGGRFAAPHSFSRGLARGPADFAGGAAGPNVGARRLVTGLAAAHLGAAAFQHGRFDWRRFDRHYVGWAGPVFWPYAYDDLFYYTYWPYDEYWPYDNLFWAYGYDDLFAGVLPQYGYARRYGYAAPGPAIAAAGRPPSGPESASSLAQFCEPAQPIAGEAPIKRIADAVQPNPEQRVKLDALGKAEAKAANELRASCPTQTPKTALGRLDEVQARIQAMLNAVDAVRGPLDDFYASLSDEQKARFDLLGANQATKPPAGVPASLTQFCGPQNAVPVISMDEIDKAVKPDQQQRAGLVALHDAASNADQMILATCPAHPPLTPPGRLDAVRDRLQAMLRAIDVVRPALQSFYASLSDDQKARFDALAEQGPGQNKA